MSLASIGVRLSSRREAVGGECRRTRPTSVGLPFWKMKMRGADAGVRLEHAGRQRDDGLQVAVGQQQLAHLAVGLAGAEQHAVGHDDAGAAACRSGGR